MVSLFDSYQFKLRKHFNLIFDSYSVFMKQNRFLIRAFESQFCFLNFVHSIQFIVDCKHTKQICHLFRSRLFIHHVNV
jgi:hypothetical protein